MMRLVDKADLAAAQATCHVATQVVSISWPLAEAAPVTVPKLISTGGQLQSLTVGANTL